MNLEVCLIVKYLICDRNTHFVVLICGLKQINGESFTDLQCQIRE